MSNRAIALTAAAMLSVSALPATVDAGTTQPASSTDSAPGGFGSWLVLAGGQARTASAPVAAVVGIAPRVHATTAASGAPAIAGRSPARNATGVSRTTNVRVRFTKAVRASTIRIRLKDALTGLAVPGKLTYVSSTHVATFNPTPTLRSHRRYVVVVSGAKDSAGTVMAKSSWSFTTRP